jgi:hypothetical protein
LVGDSHSGDIYELSLDKYTDNGATIRRVRTAQVVHNDRKRLFHSQLEIEFEAGVGAVFGDDSNPQAMLDWSDDGGHVWGNEHWTGIGAIGEYKNRAVWRRLGASRERIYRLTVTNAVKPIVIGAHLEAISAQS